MTEVTQLPLHGGKDGHPCPVDRELYDRPVEVPKKIGNVETIGECEKKRAFSRLGAFYGRKT